MGFSPIFSLLIPTSSLLYRPRLLTVPLQPVQNALLPMFTHSTTSVTSLSPLTLSAQNHIRPVSYYALLR